MTKGDLISRNAIIKLLDLWLSVPDYNEAERHIMMALRLEIEHSLPANNWISVKDRMPDMLEPFWAACKSLTDERDNWTIEGIYKGTTFGGPWGVPIVEMGKAEVYAWKPKEIPEPPKEE